MSMKVETRRRPNALVLACASASANLNAAQKGGVKGRVNNEINTSYVPLHLTTVHGIRLSRSSKRNPSKMTTTLFCHAILHHARTRPCQRTWSYGWCE